MSTNFPWGFAKADKKSRKVAESKHECPTGGCRETQSMQPRTWFQFFVITTATDMLSWSIVKDLEFKGHSPVVRIEFSSSD